MPYAANSYIIVGHYMCNTNFMHMAISQHKLADVEEAADCINIAIAACKEDSHVEDADTNSR